MALSKHGAADIKQVMLLVFLHESSSRQMVVAGWADFVILQATDSSVYFEYGQRYFATG